MQQTANIHESLQGVSLDTKSLQDPAQLIVAFEQFSRLSDQLQASYQVLDTRAVELTKQLACAQDERLKQLNEKEQLAHRLEILLNALPVGVLVVDDNDVISTANPVAENILEQSLLGKKWKRVYKQCVSRHSDQDLYLKSGRILSLKKQILNTLTDENKTAEIILLDDISEQRMLENLADRQNRLAAMGQMAAGLAHQLRTPLASAVLYASQLSQFTSDNPKQTKAVDKIRMCMRYLEKLINDMLMYAKGGEFAEQQFQLNDLLVTFNTRIENRLKEHNVQLKIISKLDNIPLSGSVDALVSVVINLVENAMQACFDDCEIELEVYQQANYLILAVRDNGPGLSVDQQKEIFQPFFTLREGGTGLGLSVAQSIVQAHHGDLLVRSQLGKGSSFYMCLPLCQSEQFLASGDNATINLKNIIK